MPHSGVTHVRLYSSAWKKCNSIHIRNSLQILTQSGNYSVLQQLVLNAEFVTRRGIRKIDSSIPLRALGKELRKRSLRCGVLLMPGAVTSFPFPGTVQPGKLEVEVLEKPLHLAALLGKVQWAIGET